MRKITAVLTVLLLTTLSAFSQEKISGKVTDANGAPLGGISVKIKGTNTGTSTASDGSFSLSGKSDATLEFSGVGFESKAAKVTKGIVSISLKQDAKSLSEVVVTGVGAATSKRKVAIDVVSVTSKNFAKSATTSIEQSIMGQVAGAQIQQTSGNANSGFSIILRGINSLGGTQPMILLDGLEVTNLSDIDPNSVDRVEIVKGAAAGMLYGAQGANGVIQVFSKKGQKGKMNITFSTKTNWDKIIRLNDIVAKYHHYLTTPDGYVSLPDGVTRIAHDAIGTWPAATFLDPSVDGYNVQNNKPYLEPTYDHISQAFTTAKTEATSINISGGSDKMDYSFTASNLYQQDVYSNDFKRLNVGLNLGMELFKGFTLRSNTQTFFTEDNLVGSANSRFAMVNNLAYIDFKYRDSIGHLVMRPRDDDNQHNPLSEQEWHQNSGKATTIMQSINANYKFPKFVTVDYKFGLNKIFDRGYDYYLNQKSALDYSLPWGSTADGSIFKSNDTRTLINSLVSVFLNTDFEKDFNLKIPLKTVTQFSYDYRKDSRSYFDATGSGLPTYPPYNISGATTHTSSDTSSTFITFGYLINQSFDYANLFGINGGLRSDYSSAFGAGEKPATFYRLGGYFRPSEFIRSNILTDWKLRSSYGEAGIQPGAYDRQTTLAVAAFGDGSSIYSPTLLANPDLKVQTSKELEIGTDFTLTNPSSGSWLRKANFSATYWKRKSEDIIQKQDIAVSGGGALQKLDNLSTISSKGLDLSLDLNVLDKKNLQWNFSYRMGFAKSTVDKIANHADVIIAGFGLKEGHSVGAIYGEYLVKDINQLDENGNPYIDPADKKYYVLVNGALVDTRTNAHVVSNPGDQREIGNIYPKFNAAFINNFTYKNNLTLSFQFDWYYGNDIYNQTRNWLNRDEVGADYDKAVNVGGNYGAFVNYYKSLYTGSVSPMEYYVEKGSFLRLRNLSLSYNVASLLKMKWVKTAELTLAGRNLWTYTKYQGLDPENVSVAVDSQGKDVSKDVAGFKGVDYFGVPNTRSYQIGIVLGF